MRQARSFRSLLLLLAVLNVLGSPMAWANWLGAAAPAETQAMEADSPPCHGAMMTSGDSQPDFAPASRDHSSPPCCAHGSCTCAVPALLTLSISLPARVPLLPLALPCDARPLPTRPLDDKLRPPIR